jgi:hypothetical protein
MKKETEADGGAEREAIEMAEREKIWKEFRLCVSIRNGHY